MQDGSGASCCRPVYKITAFRGDVKGGNVNLTEINFQIAKNVLYCKHGQNNTDRLL